MEAPGAHPWFLRKQEDGRIFGPVEFEQLTRWASLAQIAPHDSLSADQEHWIKAPMLPELAMDWIVEVTSERLYGPTTLGAIREFVRLGEIDQQTFVINSCDGTRKQVRDLAAVLEALHQTSHPEEDSSSPVAAGLAIESNERIQELEQALREERLALRESEARYRELEEKYRALLTP